LGGIYDHDPKPHLTSIAAKLASIKTTRKAQVHPAVLVLTVVYRPMEARIIRVKENKWV
jgi:hypothetical protein